MLKDKLESLKTLPTATLKEMFAQYYKQTSNTGNRDYYISRIAYKLQEAEYGGLSSATKFLLQQIKEPEQNFSTTLSIGSQIIKYYKGVRYIVTVGKHNFECEGKVYKSLSAVAAAITGRKISGNFFFKVKAEEVNGAN